MSIYDNYYYFMRQNNNYYSRTWQKVLLAKRANGDCKTYSVLYLCFEFNFKYLLEHNMVV